MTQYDDERLWRGYVAAKESDGPLQELAYGALARKVGNISGLKVADFACGNGASTRKLLIGASPRLIVGYDISTAMLAKALEVEAQRHQGIAYLQADLSNDTAGVTRQNFHRVTAMWLLHYAKDPKTLAGFAHTMYNALAPGGKMVTVVGDKCSPNWGSRQFGEWRTWIDLPGIEGSRVRMELLDPKGNVFCHFDYYSWSRATYTEALRAAGFTDIEWSDLKFSYGRRRTLPDFERIERLSSCSLLSATRPQA